ncbi:MAG: hypothetical protein HYY32_02675, partial [Chloroflexi bacterium]|nr:hypothetical protein [Chloroflexota bacterium]
AERADKLERKVADYIACMTDYYALRKGDELVQSSPGHLVPARDTTVQP